MKFNFKKFKNFEVLFTAFILVAVFGFYTVFAAEKDNVVPAIIEREPDMPREIFTIENGPEDSNIEIQSTNIRMNNDLPTPVIKPEFPVFVEVDGKKQTTMTHGGTVKDLLNFLGIELYEGDVVNLPLSKEVSHNDHISVSRMTTSHIKENSDISSPIVYKQTSLLKNGRTRVLSYGRKGTLESVYELKSINGKIVEKNLVEENVLLKPTDTVILVGKSGAPISDLDFGYSLDANGIPTSYKYVLKNQVATGYSSSGRPRGASGMRLFYGYVATDPSKIPYGTKMYIASPDGSFVYGYAIAADTGTGLLQGIIDVDLFYETYLESCLNSRRNVDIYILN